MEVFIVRAGQYVMLIDLSNKCSGYRVIRVISLAYSIHCMKDHLWSAPTTKSDSVSDSNSVVKALLGPSFRDMGMAWVGRRFMVRARGQTRAGRYCLALIRYVTQDRSFQTASFPSIVLQGESPLLLYNSFDFNIGLQVLSESVMYHSRGRGSSRRGRGKNGSSTKVPLKGLFADGIWKCTSTPHLSPLLHPLSRFSKLTATTQVTATPASQRNTSRPRTAAKTTAAGSTPASTPSPNAAISSSGTMKPKGERPLPY